MPSENNFSYIRQSPDILLVFKCKQDSNFFMLEDYSSSAAEFFGFASDSEMDFPDLTHFWERYFHKEDLPHLFQLAYQLISHKEEKISFTCRAKNKEGRYRYLSGFVKTREIDGDLYAFANYFDIEAIHLLDQEFWFHFLPAHLVLNDAMETEMMNFPIYWTDRKLRFLGVNHSFLKFFHIENEADVIGKTISELKLFEPDQEQRIIANETAIMEQGSFERGEMSFSIQEKKHLVSYIESPLFKDGKIVGLMGSFHDITRQREALEKLHDMAYLDFLTGIANRRAFYKKYEEVKKDGEPFALLILDLDGFKLINDQFGHEAGDYVLQQAARYMDNVIGEDGFISRFGGDEFALLLFYDDEERIKKLMKKLSLAVRSIHRYCQNIIKLDVSCGYALSKETDDVDFLLDIADKRMYEEKRFKKNING